MVQIKCCSIWYFSVCCKQEFIFTRENCPVDHKDSRLRYTVRLTRFKNIKNIINKLIKSFINMNAHERQIQLISQNAAGGDIDTDLSGL